MGLSGLWLPPSATDPPEKVYRCKTPGCGATFRESERGKWQRHVIACDRKNEDIAQAELAALDASSFTSVKHSDEEQLSWWRRRVARGGKPPKKPLIGV